MFTSIETQTMQGDFLDAHQRLQNINKYLEKAVQGASNVARGCGMGVNDQQTRFWIVTATTESNDTPQTLSADPYLLVEWTNSDGNKELSAIIHGENNWATVALSTAKIVSPDGLNAIPVLFAQAEGGHDVRYASPDKQLISNETPFPLDIPPGMTREHIQPVFGTVFYFTNQISLQAVPLYMYPDGLRLNETWMQEYETRQSNDDGSIQQRMRHVDAILQAWESALPLLTKLNVAK